MKSTRFIALAVVTFALPAVAQAQTAGNLLAAPFNTLGGAVSGAAASHAGIAPVVDSVSPTVEPATDGVTNAIGAVGTGLTGTGAQTQANGVRVGTHADGSPVISIGKTSGNQGSLVAVAGGRR